MFTHIDSHGKISMVDVGDKPESDRQAIACGKVVMSAATISAIKENRTTKGDPLETARLAGIMAAKQTDRLIPLCHGIPLSFVDIKIELEENAVQIIAQVRTRNRTGVEMEALTAVSVAALTIYDMCKAIDKNMIITEIFLREKTGGTSKESLK